MKQKSKKKLRSHEWFFGANETGLLHRGALRSGGINMDNYTGQPVIGIANTWGELNNCNLSLKAVAEEVKKGIKEAGGIPLEFPVITLGEELMKPSAMLYRNLLSMDVEENLRSYPIDGVVLLGNCDKTVPGLLMGALSANLPAIQLNAGPKKVGEYKGKRLGSGTDLWKYWDELRKEKITNEEWETIGKALSCGMGSCNTMGTASTMNGLLEGLGMMPLGLSTLPVDSEERFAISKDAGKRIVAMVEEDLKPSDILTPASFKNAVMLCMALGGSTNAIIHLTAISGRLNISLYPDIFNNVGSKIPCIADVQPAGKKLIDEFDIAGGIPAVLYQLKEVLDLSVKTYTGNTLDTLINNINPSSTETIRSLSSPVMDIPTIAILKGNLAPNGAVIKVAAASKNLLVHTGKAIVFDNYEVMLENIDNDDLEVDANSILILRNAGPKGVPGMPEWGMIPIPKKLQLLGITDLVRISDARMSGTSFGTVILHVVPEAAIGGPLALVKNGDIISIDIPQRKLQLEVSEEELALRKTEWVAPLSRHKRGYPKLYIDAVLQADEGCDFNFLKPKNDEELEFVLPVVGRS
ncbi:MAG: dihydroxy-acid dehydratase [Bacteroidota bacterium]|nr:dihydroxy-acid dehydratase [Bacteroidota bacterium]